MFGRVARVVLLATCCSSAAAQSTAEALVDVEWRTDNARVNELVLSLTAEEKVSLVHGTPWSGTQNFAGYVNAVPRLGIPPVQLADGESGIDGVVNATALPSQLNVGATWSRKLAYAHGHVTGLEARLLNATVPLAPRVNILRDPFTGRFWQSYSEDAYINSQLGVQGVHGIQDQGVMANTKQIGPSSSGASKGDDNSEVDLQVLHEIYWAPHEALIGAGAATVMCSYAQVNGVPSCQSDEILNNTLRGDWNFTGIVMSDWTAAHSTAASIMAGLDWEQGSHEYFTQPLYDQVYVYKNLSESYLNRAVHRILSTYEKFGLLDGRGSQGNSTDMLVVTNPLPDDVVQESQDLAYDIAVRSAVLLKNDGAAALPLKNGTRLAVIGPSGIQFSNGAGFAERAWGFEDRKISPLQALQEFTRADISSAVGVDLHGSLVPASALRTLNGEPGLSRNDSAGVTSIDSQLSFNGSNALAANTDFEWTGQILADTAGYYRLALQRRYPNIGSDKVNDTDYIGIKAVYAFTINGTSYSGFRLLGNGGLRPWSSPIPTEDGWDEKAADVWLEEGWHNVTVTVPSIFDDPLEIRLSWTTPAGRASNIADAVQSAKEVDVPIVFAHADSPAATGMQLLQGLDDLVNAVATANPRTVVVLYNSEPVLMPWLDKVASVLWMGHPGQEGGRALADLLYGVRSPQGRLPVTYPSSVEATVTRNPKYPERMDTENGTAIFSEGINSGYRWYLSENVTTLFPFGYGLSYTSFVYDDLAVEKRSGETFVVSFTLRNTGTVAGAEVPQMYIGPPAQTETRYPGIQFAVSTLAGFDSVDLGVGAIKRVSFLLDSRQLSYWNQTDRSWGIARGERDVWIGRNSQQRELVGSIKVA